MIFGRNAHRRLRIDGAVGPDFQRQLVIVGALLNAGIGHPDVDAANR